MSKNIDKYEKDLYLYAEGKEEEVSSSFLKALDEDAHLLQELYRLREELMLMEKLPDSPLYSKKRNQKRLAFSLKTFDIFENFLNFSTFMPVAARGEKNVLSIGNEDLEIVKEAWDTFSINIFGNYALCELRLKGKVLLHKEDALDVSVKGLKAGCYELILNDDTFVIDAKK